MLAFGRPRRTLLYAIGGIEAPELPVRPDVTGVALDVEDCVRVSVRLMEIDGEEGSSSHEVDARICWRCPTSRREIPILILRRVQDRATRLKSAQPGRQDAGQSLRGGEYSTRTSFELAAVR